MSTLRLCSGALAGLAVTVSLAVAQPPSFVDPPQGGAAPPIPTTPSFHSTLPHETSGGDCFSSSNCVDEPARNGGPIVFGEFLWMRARRQAQDFVIVDPSLNGAIDGNLSSAQWDSNYGFRVGAGWALADGWEALATYTYFHTNDDRSWNTPPGGVLIATRSNPFTDTVTSAGVSSNLDYDVIDVDIAKTIDAYDRLDLRLSAGLRYANVQQKFNAVYAGGTVPGAGPLLVSSPVYFDGFGLRVGGEGNWRLLGGLSLYAKGYGTLMSGEFRTTLRETFNGGASSINLSDKYQAIVPVAELGAGVAWTTEHVRVKVGYELTNWFNFADGLDMVNGQSMGKYQRKMSDLSLEGLAVQIGFMY